MCWESANCKPSRPGSSGIANMLVLLITMCAIIVSAEARFSNLPRHSLRPVYHGRYVDQCYDAQIHQNFYVGETWSSSASNCKQSNCIEKDGQLFIDQFSCPSVLGQVDRRRVEDQKLDCRQAFGDRRKAFPECCPTLVCRYFNDEHKLVPLPEEEYPWL